MNLQRSNTSDVRGLPPGVGPPRRLPLTNNEDKRVAERLFELVILTLVVACITWTLAHEEVVREPREWLIEKSKTATRWWTRKFFFMWTCEFCLSYYVAAAVILIMDFRLITDDWRGIAAALLATTALANAAMSAFARLRVELGTERVVLDRAKHASDAAPKNAATAIRP